MKAITVKTFLLLLILTGNITLVEGGSSMVVISRNSDPVLTVINFNRIQQFIITQGKKQTYCNMFNNNPYWSFPGFNAYLNPPDQNNIDCEIGKSDFNILVFQIEALEGTQYWHVSLDKRMKKIFIQQLHSKTNKQVLIKKSSEFFEIALMEIERHTKHKPQ